MHMPYSEAKAARRARQRAAAMVEPNSSGQCARSVLVDPEKALLREVTRHSLTTEESNARRLQRKNSKALWLGLEAS